MLTAQVESLPLALEEMKPLLPLHWQELGVYQDLMPLDPDFAEYERLEGAGVLTVVTLRQDASLIGYFLGVITPGLHYKSTLTCKMDIAYILPEHRGGGGKLLFDETRKELKRRGVKLWWVGSKDHHPIEGFYEAMGFERQESYFAAWLGD